ncbi:MAG: zinc ABC transporter substrate-binding protein, partial [Clostridia bacterium]|nr:zinc ABC transporter substrate-binding protein [Clostridia bacterium]
MKKLLSFAAALFVLLSCFAPATAEAGKISVVTTIFPIYDWVREIVGANDNVDVSILLDSGVDLHSYQPTVQDILKVSAADVFAYVGGESDEWVEGALAEAVNPEMKVVNLVEAMGEDIKMEEIVEGMEHEHDHDHDHDDHDHDEDDHDHDEDDHDHDEDEHDHEHEHEHEEEADEHVWLSLRNAQKLVAALTDALCKADPADAEAFRANAAAYIEKLAALDAQYSEAVSSAAFRT